MGGQQLQPQPRQRQRQANGSSGTGSGCVGFASGKFPALAMGLVIACFLAMCSNVVLFAICDDWELHDESDRLSRLVVIYNGNGNGNGRSDVLGSSSSGATMGNDRTDRGFQRRGIRSPPSDAGVAAKGTVARSTVSQTNRTNDQSSSSSSSSKNIINYNNNNSSSNSNSNSNNNNNNKDDDGKEHDDDPYEKVSPDWKFTSPATDQQVVDGVRAWCKAGEDKTGWDLSKIPKTCHTTREVLVGNGGKDENEDEDHKDDDDGNVLLRLYRDLCARKSAVDADREAIEDRFEWRTSLCTYFAWAVPNAKAIRTLVDLKQPILEVGAGTGYWAWLLSQKGVDTAAYDLADSQGGQKHRFRHSIVKDGSVEQVSAPEHSNRILLVCWPDIVGDSAQDDADRGSFGTETLKTYQGDTVVHIGELESTGVAA
eukprot:CAMPEP_0172357176 /NCGR_PEP_ID=MMETSP1060-20121228/1556_1 /TAXON_ID=37318 /ORGANISM="Pseudo-nitzschia pungens, Strain cf. cingulata" /LENGTH=426 /DNA_ID=CAMNT_0013077715 /DNA_START=413 /DNA_END=1690 /DNA_ORIENTATION=+